MLELGVIENLSRALEVMVSEVKGVKIETRGYIRRCEMKTVGKRKICLRYELHRLAHRLPHRIASRPDPIPDPNAGQNPIGFQTHVTFNGGRPHERVP
jgi:hypothetical protein